MEKAYYAVDLLSHVRGVKVPYLKSTIFNEFVVNFDGTSKRVEEINKALYHRGILGGKDLTQEFPQFGNSALYCVTEVHSINEIDRLAKTIEEVTR